MTGSRVRLPTRFRCTRLRPATRRLRSARPRVPRRRRHDPRMLFERGELVLGDGRYRRRDGHVVERYRVVSRPLPIASAVSEGVGPRPPSSRTDRSPWKWGASHRPAGGGALARLAYARACGTSPSKKGSRRTGPSKRASPRAPTVACVCVRSLPDGSACSSHTRHPSRRERRSVRHSRDTPLGSGASVARAFSPVES